MAVFDAVTSTSFTSSATSADVSHTFGNTANLSLVVSVSFGSSGTQVVSSVEVDPDGTPTALVSLGTIENTGGGDGPRVEVWGLQDATTFQNTTQTIRMTLSLASNTGGGYGAISVSAANNGFGTFVGAAGTCGTTPSITLTSATDELCIDGVGGRRQDGGPDAGQIERFHFTVTQHNAAGSTELGAASVVMGWGCAGGGAPHWAQGGVSVKNAAAGGGGLSIPVAMANYRRRHELGL